MRAPYPANRLHNQHPPPPASESREQPNRAATGGSILNADSPAQQVKFARRNALLEALGPNGRLMTDLIPELKLIIGDQPPVPKLEPQQSQSRFQLVLRRFIGVFTWPEHPLALFLDDMQCLDAATLDLIEDLLIRSDLRQLMLIGAYRD